MFIISFAIFIFALTIFENIFLAVLFLVLLLIGYGVFKRFKDIKAKALLTLLAFVLALSSVFVKNYTYDYKIKNLENLTGRIAQDMDGPVGKYFIGTGTISDIYSYQRFIFQDNAGREYFLYSENKYEIGDIVWLNGGVSLAYTGAKNIFDISRQWKKITSKPEFSGFLNYEFNYPKWLMMKNFYGTIYEQSAILLTEKTVGIRGDPELNGLDESEFEGTKSKISLIQKIRKSLQKSTIEAYGETKQAGLILGMLVGDRSQIPPDDYQGFVDSGLVHIIAVSGGNIIMIVVFLSAILFFLPFYVKNAVLLVSIIFYAMICGMDSSVFRATIMGGLGMLALFWGKEINIWRAMSIAFIVMLLINPYFMTYDVGFLLSFSAIVGIVYFNKVVDHISEILKNKKKEKLEETGKPKKNKKFWKSIGKNIKDLVVPTIGATLGVLPIMLFFMGKTNLTGILANFLVVPLVALVMIYGFISVVLFQILPWEIWLWPEKLLLNYVYMMSNLAQKFGIFLQAEGNWIKYLLLTLFVVWLIAERQRK